MACVICAEGECSPCCIFLNLFPAEAPFTEESKSQAAKIVTSKNMHLVTRNLLSAKIRGGFDAEKALVESWIMEYDARQKNPVYGLAGIVNETENRIKSLQEKIEMYKNRYGPLEDVARLSKSTTSLD